MTTQHMACPSAELLKTLVFCPQSQSPDSDPRKPAPDQVVKTEFLLLQPPPLFIIIFPERIAKFERRKQEKGSFKFQPLGPSLLPESASLFVKCGLDHLRGCGSQSIPASNAKEPKGQVPPFPTPLCLIPASQGLLGEELGSRHTRSWGQGISAPILHPGLPPSLLLSAFPAPSQAGRRHPHGPGPTPHLPSPAFPSPLPPFLPLPTPQTSHWAHEEQGPSASPTPSFQTLEIRDSLGGKVTGTRTQTCSPEI